MTTKEFSDNFDVLLNSYSSQPSFGEASFKADIILDEYEKSVLLTQAQDIVIKSYFDNRLNPEGEGFDDSAKRQIDFSSLITVTTLIREEEKSDVSSFDPRGIIYKFPSENNNTSKVLFVLNEQLLTTDNKNPKVTNQYVVVPINYKEYDREMSKTYAQPLKKQVWRLFQNDSKSIDIYSEIIPVWDLETRETINSYKVRYVRRPNPIILTTLSDGMDIEGFSTVTECELNPILHPEILRKAVELALISRGRGTQQSSQDKS